VLGRTYGWLSDIEWREQYGTGGAVEEDALVDEYTDAFALDRPGRVRLRRLLHEWRDAIPAKNRSADLVGELYTLLDQLDVRRWDLDDPRTVNKLGTLARLSALLADYESVRRRARPDADKVGEQVGGEDRGPWYYKNLAIHIVNYAQGEYEGFDGEPDFELDAVDLTTIHRAKGLGWPVVFVPSVTANRFPTTNAGRPQPRLVPRSAFAADRYEGGDADERRLFYVAMTRARDWLSVSRHARMTTKAVGPSPYWLEMGEHLVEPEGVVLPEASAAGPGEDEPITVTYSEMAAFLDCGDGVPPAQPARLPATHRPRAGLRQGRAPRTAGGGRVHRGPRAGAARRRGGAHFPSRFLPAGGQQAGPQAAEGGRRAPGRHLPARPRGRPVPSVGDRAALRAAPRRRHRVGPGGRDPRHGGRRTHCPGHRRLQDVHALQLQVYADAGRREGLNVRAAYVHDLKATRRDTVDVAQVAIDASEQVVTDAAVRLRAREFQPAPGLRCRACEVRTVCAAAQP